MSDVLAARIRTWWPILLGHVAAIIVAVVLRWTGVTLDSALVLEAVSWLLSGAVWEAGRWLESRQNKLLAAVGRWLVSAGMVIGSPTYPASTSAKR